MRSRWLIPALFGALLVGFLAGCAPATDTPTPLQVQATPPDSEIIDWKGDQLMATGGDLVLNQFGCAYRG